MYSLLKVLLRKAKKTYHQVLYAYNFILYRDCLDLKMKEHFYTKLKYHEQKIN
ncbi:hypothetical protein SAMN03159341_103268 [Paenibacillus sp. 1_12]|nr:hypothetical protein SAMN03159341_103268 [Paenibacillus sp. 1_12]